MIPMKKNSETGMERFLSFRIAILIGVVVLGSLVITTPPCSAAMLINGTLYYADVIENDIHESGVMPGDTIVLGRTYDLTKVIGVSKIFAWWQDPYQVETSCKPDLLYPVGYVETNGKIRPNNVTLDPEIWKTGSYWQWDGCFISTYGSKKGTLVPYVADNNLAFKVINDPFPEKITPVPTTEITPLPNVTPDFEVNLSEDFIIITPEITTIPNPVQKESIPWYYYLLGIFGIIIVFKYLW